MDNPTTKLFAASRTAASQREYRAMTAAVLSYF